MTTIAPTLAAPALADSERLRGGIWPRSAAVWVAAVYLALFVIRPWEMLFPELGEIAFERWMVISTVLLILLLRGPSIDLSRQKVAVLALFGAVAASTITAVSSDLAHPRGNTAGAGLCPA